MGSAFYIHICFSSKQCLKLPAGKTHYNYLFFAVTESLDKMDFCVLRKHALWALTSWAGRMMLSGSWLRPAMEPGGGGLHRQTLAVVSAD